MNSILVAGSESNVTTMFSDMKQSCSILVAVFDSKEPGCPQI